MKKVLFIKDAETGTFEAVDTFTREFTLGFGYENLLNLKEIKLNFPNDLARVRVGESIDYSKYNGTQIGDILEETRKADYIFFADAVRDFGIPDKVASLMYLVGRFLNDNNLTDKRIIVFWIAEGIYSEAHMRTVCEVTDRTLSGIRRETLVMHQSDALIDLKYSDYLEERRKMLYIIGLEFAMRDMLPSHLADQLAKCPLSMSEYMRFRKKKSNNY